jgi:elongation factor Ts
MIDSKQVKELRDKTGVSVMKCRKALEEAGGNMKEAEVILQKESHFFAQKKAQREVKSGIIASYVHNTGGIGAMVELLCETDFVAKNKEFKDLAYNIAMQVVATDPKYLSKEDVSENTDESNSSLSEDILLEQVFIKDPSLKVGQLIDSYTQKFGEKITISRFNRYSIS